MKKLTTRKSADTICTGLSVREKVFGKRTFFFHILFREGVVYLIEISKGGFGLSSGPGSDDNNNRILEAGYSTAVATLERRILLSRIFNTIPLCGVSYFR